MWRRKYKYDQSNETVSNSIPIIADKNYCE